MKRFIRVFRISFFVFLLSFFCIHCRHPAEKPSVAVVSKNNKAVGVVIRGVSLGERDLATRLKVQLIKPGERVPVLGEFKLDNDEVVFESLVPLTRGLKYEVLLDDTLLSEIEIPFGEAVAPELVSIYPTQDTLPENLLKMYFEFSVPMVEGTSLNHITLISQVGDTLQGTFLDLQPELWNVEGTVLTLWLDPGRIKRDLIPNKELGTPLKASQQYTLHVSKSWSSKHGLQLSKTYAKTFVTTNRDEDSPDPAMWKVNTPPSNTRQALEIQFPQPLDYFLAKEAISIRNVNGDAIPGKTEIDDEERICRFMPDELWSAGHFALHIESRLEDLAGNNLNRPFERNIKKGNEKQEQEVFIREFEIP